MNIKLLIEDTHYSLVAECKILWEYNDKEYGVKGYNKNNKCEGGPKLKQTYHYTQKQENIIIINMTN